MIRRQDDGFWFFDLGSINGAYINGRRVTTSQLLVHGDQLRIADHRFKFQREGDPATLLGDETATDVTLVDMRSVDAILLVSDIQEFTKLSERLKPDQLAPIIGSWYQRTERILSAHGANLDKFLGDSVLAYWLDTSPETRLNALRAADAMSRACEEVSRKHHEILRREALQFRSGAAIHIGPTAYGAFSSHEFTLLGDAVNVVFRLESLTRELGSNVLVSGDLFRGWEAGRAHCRSLGSQAVKGRHQQVDVYAFNGFAED
jgi:adenylate cyclase